MNRTSSFFSQANHLYECASYEDALTMYQRSLQDEGCFYFTYSKIGDCYRKLGIEEKAQEAYANAKQKALLKAQDLASVITPPEEDSPSEDSVASFMSQVNFGDYLCHQRRFMQSWEYLKNYLKDDCFTEILEVGSENMEYPFTRMIQEFYPSRNIHFTSGDLRTTTLDIESNSLDIALCMEVIEHLPDLGDQYMDVEVFKGTGIKNMLDECKRVLKKNHGVLFLTTPSVSSYLNIYRCLVYEHPFFWKPHPRELSFVDVQDFLAESGFTILKAECFNSWDWGYMDPNLVRKIEELVDSLGFSTENRGDNMFFLAQA